MFLNLQNVPLHFFKTITGLGIIGKVDNDLCVTRKRAIVPSNGSSVKSMEGVADLGISKAARWRHRVVIL